MKASCFFYSGAPSISPPLNEDNPLNQDTIAWAQLGKRVYKTVPEIRTNPDILCILRGSLVAIDTCVYGENEVSCLFYAASTKVHSSTGRKGTPLVNYQGICCLSQ